MELSLEKKNRIREIISRIISKDRAWLDEYCFLVGDKSDCWIINYNIYGKNEYNCLTRGMVVRKPIPSPSDTYDAIDVMKLIDSFPMERFFNQHEPQADTIDFENSEMIEKMDGMMVGVYFPQKTHSMPAFHTRQMVSHQEEMMMKTFYGTEYPILSLTRSYVEQIKFAPADVNYTFTFEFIHEATKVITKYTPDQWGLYLLAARDLTTYRELSEEQLDAVALSMGVKRPRRWASVADHDEIVKMFDAAATPDFEGFVFRDKTTGKRIKVKDPRYVEKHHLLGLLSYKHLIPLIFKGESDEIVAYFPHAKVLIDEFNEKYQAWLQKTYDTILEWRAKKVPPADLYRHLYGHNALQKWEIRLKAMRGETMSSFNRPYDDFTSAMIMKYFNLDKDQDVWDNLVKELEILGLGQGNNLGRPKYLAELIGLKGNLENDDCNQEL